MVFTLIFGAISVPFQAKAFCIFNCKAVASEPVPVKNDNSQSLSLGLTANASSALDYQDQKSKDDGIKNSVNVNISNGALLPITGITGTSDSSASINGGVTSDQTSVYVVRKGDSIKQIADMYKVSVNTILWANDLKKGDKLQEGDKLTILPIDGLNYVVSKGDTLKKIAKKYTVDVSDILATNDITTDSDLTIGQELIIPGAEITDEGGDKPVSNTDTKDTKDTTTISKDQDYYENNPIKNVLGYFVNPLPTGHLTQGLHDHYRAIDIGAPLRTPIYASASGTVIFAKDGTKSRYSNGGFGGLVIIRHLNGTETYYAHQSKIATSAGQQVSQGQIIGYVGSTGHSTGPHLHFEVRGTKNPGVSWF